jgi:hypothetical protein
MYIFERQIQRGKWREEHNIQSVRRITCLVEKQKRAFPYLDILGRLFFPRGVSRSRDVTRSYARQCSTIEYPFSSNKNKILIYNCPVKNFVDEILSNLFSRQGKRKSHPVRGGYFLLSRDSFMHPHNFQMIPLW